MRHAIPLTTVLALACNARSRRTEVEPAPSIAPPSTSSSVAPTTTRSQPADAGLPPLGNVAWMEPLALPGGRSGFVTVPLGATEARPIVVAVHGAGDHPGWACAGWRGVADGFPFVVCPQGTPTGNGTYYWRSTEDLGAVIELALAAVRERFAAYVVEGPMTYAGFSAGAIYGAPFVARNAARFPSVVMSEGGYSQLGESGFARAFAKGGGKRVLLGCSTGEHCRGKFRAAARLLAAAGIDARINDAGSVGHNLNGEAVASLRTDWPWLVSERPGWQSSPAVEAAK